MRYVLLSVLLACSGADKDATDAPDTDVTDAATDVTDAATDDPSTDATDVDDTDPAPTETDGTDVAPTDTDGEPTDTDVDPTDTGFSPLTCKDAGGICTSADRCPVADDLPAFAGDCVFDDGPGVCCKAPDPQPQGRTCADYGGVCAPIAGCGFVDGDFAEGTCRNAWPGLTCCVPEAMCGPHTMVCCGDGVSYVPTCDRGVLECNIPDTVLMEEANCPV